MNESRLHPEKAYKYLLHKFDQNWSEKLYVIIFQNKVSFQKQAIPPKKNKQKQNCLF